MPSPRKMKEIRKQQARKGKVSSLDPGKQIKKNEAAARKAAKEKVDKTSPRKKPTPKVKPPAQSPKAKPPVKPKSKLARFGTNIKRGRGIGLGVVIAGGLAALHKHIKGEPSKTNRYKIVKAMQDKGKLKRTDVAPENIKPPLAGELGLDVSKSKPKVQGLKKLAYVPAVATQQKVTYPKKPEVKVVADKELVAKQEDYSRIKVTPPLRKSNKDKPKSEREGKADVVSQFIANLLGVRYTPGTGGSAPIKHAKKGVRTESGVLTAYPSDWEPKKKKKQSKMGRY